VKKSLLKTLYKTGAFAPFRWTKRDKVLILTYHRFGTGDDRWKISAQAFEAHLEYLGRYHRIISLDDAIEYLKEGKTPPANSTVITIDDGYADAYEIAFPVLKKFGFPGTVYAVTDFLDQKIWMWTDAMRFLLQATDATNLEIDPGLTVPLTGEIGRIETANRINARLKQLPETVKKERLRQFASDLRVELPVLPPIGYSAMTWEQAREMDRSGVKLESHTVSHPILTNVERDSMEFELRVSKSRMEERLGRPVKHFCYPNGTLDKVVSDAAMLAGYESAVTTAYGFNEAGVDRFLLNRIDAQAPIENFVQSVSGFEDLRKRSFRGSQYIPKPAPVLAPSK